MVFRLFLLLSFSVALFGSGTYTGWRAARWLDPVLDAKDRSIAVSQTLQDTFGGLFDEQ
jgi:hypothetical protein